MTLTVCAISSSVAGSAVTVLTRPVRKSRVFEMKGLPMGLMTEEYMSPVCGSILRGAAIE